jgi:outer membrane murein-binding lipoprotein Lpp
VQIDATSIAPDPAGTTVADAADALGITPESVRRRLRAGTLDGWQVDGPKGPEWRVTLPRAGTPVPEVVEAPTADAHAIVGALRAHVADLQGEVARLRADLDGARADAQAARSEVAARSADVGRLVEALAALTTTALPKPEPERRPWWRALIGG